MPEAPVPVHRFDLRLRGQELLDDLSRWNPATQLALQTRPERAPNLWRGRTRIL